MRADQTDKPAEITKRHRYLLLGAAVMTYLLVTAGGVVCATESGHGCPDWPACYGRALPPLRIDAIIEYTHRLIALLASPLIVGAAVVGWWKTRSVRWVSWPSILALLLAILVSAFGALVVLQGLPRGWAAVDLGAALLALALVLTAAVVASARYLSPGTATTLSLRSPFAKLAAATLLVLFAVLVSGVLVAQTGSIERCLGWPLYRGGGAPADLSGWLHLGRRLLAGLATLLIVAVAIQGWQARPGQGQLRKAAAGLGTLFLAHLIIGVLLVTVGFNILLLVLYVATIVAVWALLVVVLVAAALVRPGRQRNRQADE